MSEYLEYYHNKGEQDAVGNNYDPPHGLLEEFTNTESLAEIHIEENEAYDGGYYHTRGQIDYQDNDYNPPPERFEHCREAYDAGWEAAKEETGDEDEEDAENDEDTENNPDE